MDFDLDVNAGPQGGGNTVTASASGLLASVTTPGARFVVGANTTCPATYSTTSAGSLTATVTKSDDDTAKIVVPAVALGSTYRVCMYVGTATGSVTQGKTTAIEAYVPEASTVSITPNAANPATTASPVSIVASSSGPWLQNQSTVSAIFTSATCPATYSATGATTATVTKNAANTTATISAPTTLTNGATYNVCYYNGTANTSVLLGKGQYSLVPAVSLSPQFGPSAGTNTLIIQSSTNFMSSGVTAPGVIFTRLACPNTYSNASDYVGASSPLPTKINNMRLSVKVPAGVVLGSSEASAQYKVCVYGGSTAGTSKLIAQPLNYTIAASVTVSSIAPASGPAQGGQEVVITGTNFPTAEGAQVSASLGGSELTNIKVNDLGTTLTGTTTSHAPGATTVSVTTLAGTKSALGTPYAYTYGITVSPNTAPVPASAGANPPIYIQGAGFSNLTPGAAPGVAATTTGAAVYLVDNTWYAGNQASRPVNAGAKAQCYDITVITDNELICTLDLYNGLGTANILGTAPTNTVPVGTYTIAIVNDVAAVGGPVADVGFSRISSGSTFTVASY
ncbi:IPT/TIG domain-containing protein [Actinoplanes philippinensis]|uniref:IPT/TIG domain-containing protein n=1 Tax=Actinoplanes philippinensis TaxID=35752 RepID=UPI001160CDB5|nr:IPT/TIG domain-containing protein [Actinoplanes philippinensis]